jgi:glutamyl-tRNA reductase
MNLLVVGVSHHTAPVEVLERLSVPVEENATVLSELLRQPCVNEAVVLSTCNRVEVYATVTAFHGGLAQIGAVLAERAGLAVAALADHLYAHHNADGVRHAMRVAAGLDSMVVGEAQILGQLRDAYAVAADQDAAGRLLHEVMQQALRVGKRVHAETDIDRAGQSIVTAALAAAPSLTFAASGLVIGAGSMGSLAVATLRRAGADPVLVANRGVDRARRLAELHGAVVVDFADLVATLSTVDLVVCATASADPVLTADVVGPALSRRTGRGTLTILDLAVPRDVAADVAQLPGVRVIDVASLGTGTLQRPSGADEAEALVADEVDAFLTWFRGAEVAPTVAALRTRADEVVQSELRRLAVRRPDLTDDQRADVALAVHRVVQRLLHSPTVRMRQLATTPGGDQYAAAVRELFDLAVPPAGPPLGPAIDVDGGPAVNVDTRGSA